MNNYLFDSHKLMYHCDRVGEFLTKNDCYPLYMEISPVGSCNHRCIFCAYDFIGHPHRKLQTERLLGCIDELSAAGLKSILYAGEGEPLLHPDMSRIITHTYRSGIDVGLFTNGHLLTPQKVGEIVPYLTFVRFSFNAGTPDNYARIHQTSAAVFDTVVNSIQRTAALKRARKLTVDIGVQFVLLPENRDTLLKAVRCVRAQGADYFVIKPFVKQSRLQAYPGKALAYTPGLEKTFRAAESLSTKRFKVVARRESFKRYGKRGYGHCLGTSFITVLNSAGDVATCLPYWDRKKFVFGNIYQESFQEIWSGARREKIKRYLERKLDVRKCPPNCRPNAVNEFLWEITHPSVKHVNFI